MATTEEESRGAAHETLLDVAGRVSGDDHHGLLPEGDGQVGGQRLRALDDLVAASLVWAHDDLDHVPVLAAALPDAARLEEGRVLELALDQALDGVPERGLVERHRQLPVAPALAGDASADVEPYGAGGLDGHGTTVPEQLTRQELEDRTGRTPSRFYLYFEVDRSTGQLSLETSWLPDLPKVNQALSPLGFHRRPDGTYCVALKDAADVVKILRCATKALALLVEEATL